MDGVTASAGVLRHFIECARYAPVQFTVGFAGVRPVGRKGRPRERCKMIINRFAAGFAEGINHVQHAVAYASAEVVDVYAWLVRQFFHRPRRDRPPRSITWM